jgi:uncharacterized membrane protein
MSIKKFINSYKDIFISFFGKWSDYLWKFFFFVRLRLFVLSSSLPSFALLRWRRGEVVQGY